MKILKKILRNMAVLWISSAVLVLGPELLLKSDPESVFLITALVLSVLLSISGSKSLGGYLLSILGGVFLAILLFMLGIPLWGFVLDLAYEMITPTVFVVGILTLSIAPAVLSTDN